jgi:sec-independent protein translocase protein TatC
VSENKSPRGENTIPDDEPKSFLEHLEELRGTIVWTAGVFITCFAGACCFVPRIMTFLAGPLSSIEGIDAATFHISYDVSEPFMIWMKVGLWSGLIVALPIIVFIIGIICFQSRAILHSL